MLLEPWLLSLPVFLQPIVRGGYLAVGTFFVLSGFVLAQSYASASWNRRSLLRYCANRYARVYPVYLLSLCVMAPFILNDLHVPQRTGAALHQKAALLANYSLVLQGWSDNLPVNWNTPAWSLSCEFFFYLCFPLAAGLLNLKGWKSKIAVAVSTVVIPAALTAAGVPGGWKPLFHLADFIIGILAAGIYTEIVRSRPGLMHRGYWFYLPAATITLLLIARPDLVLLPVSLNSALRPFNALLLIGLALGGGLPVRALSTQLAAFLGRASYSMYILHIPVLWWFKRYFAGMWAPSTSAVIYMAGVIAISGVVCERLEEPANRRIRDWVSKKVSKPSE